MTDQGFNTYFNLIDNFTAKFDAIQKRLSSVTSDKYIVDFEVSNDAVKQTQDLGKNLQKSVTDISKKKVDLKVTDNSTEVVKKVMGNVDDLQNALSQPISVTIKDLISGRLEAIGKILDGLRAKGIIPVGLSTGAAAVGMVAGVAGVAAIGMGVAATIPAAAELEDSMIRVNKLIGMEGEAAKGVQKDMQDMMMATGMGLDQVAAAYEQAGGAGVGGDLMAVGDFEGARKEISDFVRITLEASSAFGMTANATSSMLSGIANVYKPIGEETNTFLRSVGSGIDAVADATIASEEKIMTAMSHASSAMAMFEQTDETVKDTIALSAALISTNMSGDAAGEAIKDFFNYAKTDAEGNISKSLGMGGAKYQAMLKSDPMAIVEAVTAKYNAMDAEEQGAYSKLFGMTGGKIAQLSGSANFQAGLTKAQGVVNPAYDEGTKMSKSFEKSMAGFNTQLSKAGQSITVLAQTIGSIFLPGLIAILGVVNAILSPMVKFVAYVAELAGKIPGMNLIATAASILAVATAVSALVGFLWPVIAGLGLASKAFMILTMYGHMAVAAISAIGGTIGAIVGILGGPLTIILVLAAAIGYLFYKTGYLQKAWDKFKNSAIGKDLISGLVAGVGWVTDEFTKLFSWLDEQWSKGSEGAFGWLLSALDTIASTFGWLFDKIDAAYASGELGEALKIGVMGMFPITLLIKPLEAIVSYVSRLLDGSNIVADLLSAGKRVWENIYNVLSWLYDTARGMISWLRDSLGITKSDAKKKYETAVERAGGIEYLNEEGKVGWYDKQGNPVPESEVPSYLLKAFDKYQNAPGGIPEDIIGVLKKLLDAILSLPGTISAAIKSWFPGVGGAEDADRSPAEIQAGLAVEAKAPGAYAMGPNEQKISPSQWPMQYLFDTSGEFGNETVYGQGGAELGTVQDFMSLGTAMDALTQATKAGGKPSAVPGINFSEDTWLDLLQNNRMSYPNAQELYERVSSGREGTQIKSDRWGNEYLSPTPPETFKNQGRMYVAYGDNGSFDVWNASGKVKSGFESEAAAKEYISNQPQYAVGATFKKGGLFAGLVHEKEEIIPQATAQRGAGPIARALDTLYGVTAGSRSSTSSQKTEVHVHNTNDF
ncbi:MAG: phage tail tape measure protein, partial [Bacilli bacterium]